MKTLALSAFALSLLIAPASVAAVECNDLRKSQCVSRSSCQWVGGYTTQAGTRVKSYCRKRSVAEKVSSPCAALLKRDCVGKSGCTWITGYRRSDGTRVTGFCRRS